MTEDTVSFPCPACKGIADKAPKENDRFEICGIEEVAEWSDFAPDEIPALDERIWARSEQLPQPGELKAVRVSHPFHMSIGETFWTLFLPALSHFNGWDSHPEEINGSGFVQCTLERILERGENQAWVALRIKRTISLPEMDAVLPQRDGSGYLEPLGWYGEPDVFRHGEWTFFSVSAQGNLGVWALIRQRKSANLLVAMGEWEFHSSLVFGGNLVIPDEEFKAMLAKSGE